MSSKKQPAKTFYTQGATPFRLAVEKQSAPFLMSMTQMPRSLVAFSPLVLILLGFFLPLVPGLIALAIFLLLTGWLAYLSWPTADTRARILRVVMFALVIGLAVLRITRG